MEERYEELKAKGVDNLGVLELGEFLDLGLAVLRTILEEPETIFWQLNRNKDLRDVDSADSA